MADNGKSFVWEEYIGLSVHNGKSFVWEEYIGLSVHNGMENEWLESDDSKRQLHMFRV
jgi:hypothetical protein